MHVIRPAALTVASTSAVDADPEWQFAATYNTGDRVSRLGKRYISSIDGNTGLHPENEEQDFEGARWIYMTATNTQAVIDESPGQKTTGASPLTIELAVEGSFSGVALFGLECSTCTVRARNSVGDVVGERVLKSGPEIVDNWFDWVKMTFNSIPERQVMGMFGAANSTVELIIEGAAPAIGEVVVGRAIPIGKTLMNAKTKMARNTLTKIVENKFRHLRAIPRAIARDVTYQVVAPRGAFEKSAIVLDELDGTRVVTYALRDDRPEFVNIGYIMDYTLPAELPDHYIFEVTTQGVS